MTIPISIKQAEISVRRFNEMLPHHLGLLHNHRSNIQKSMALGDLNKIKKEEINASRVIKQLKNLLIEMDALREKVRADDLPRFDDMVAEGRQKAFEGLRDYMELQLKSPNSTLRAQARGDGDPFENCNAADSNLITVGNVQLPALEVDLEQHLLAQRQACLEELQLLQQDIGDLNGMFQNMREMVQEQGESVQVIADNAEEAHENVQAAETNLRRALRYKKAMYPVVGALLGTCVGGPIGLVAGLKAGGLAAVGCGILGFTGGSVLKSNEAVLLQGNVEELQMTENSADADGSVAQDSNKKDE